MKENKGLAQLVGFPQDDSDVDSNVGMKVKALEFYLFDQNI